MCQRNYSNECFMLQSQRIGKLIYFILYIIIIQKSANIAL